MSLVVHGQACLTRHALRLNCRSRGKSCYGTELLLRFGRKPHYRLRQLKVYITTNIPPIRAEFPALQAGGKPR